MKCVRDLFSQCAIKALENFSHRKDGMGGNPPVPVPRTERFFSAAGIT